MKKTIVVLIIALITSSLFANIALSIGSNIDLNTSIASYKDGINIGEITYSPEIRVKLGALELTTKNKMTSLSNTLLFSTEVGTSLVADLNVLRIGVGLVSCPITWGWMGDEFITPFINTPSEKFIEEFASSTINYRANLDILLGHLLIGVDYSVPTQCTFNQKKDIKLYPESWEDGKLTLSLLYSFY